MFVPTDKSHDREIDGIGSNDPADCSSHSSMMSITDKNYEQNVVQHTIGRLLLLDESLRCQIRKSDQMLC